MWSILYRGNTIPLPESDDLYAVITDTSKMFTTDLDVPLTEELIDAFQIRGILTLEDGKYFEKITLSCTLQGFGLSLPCKVNIESISPKNNTLHLYLEANSILGYSVTEEANKESNRSIWDTSHFPLFYDTSAPSSAQPSTPGNFYLGYETDQGKFAFGQLPLVGLSPFIQLANRLGFATENAPYVKITPVTPYMNGRYKMRRQYWALFPSTTSSISQGRDVENAEIYVAQGLYPGITKDQMKASYTREGESSVQNPGRGEIEFSSSFQTKSTTRSMRCYYQFAGVPPAAYVRCFIVSDHAFSVSDGFSATSTPAQFTGSEYVATVPLIHDGSVPFESSFFTIYPANTTTASFQLNFRTTTQVVAANMMSCFLQTQIHWDDDYEGVERVISEDWDREFSGDTNNERFNVTLKASGFSSLAWLSQQYQLYGQNYPNFNTNFASGGAFNEDFYNSSPAMMWTNTLDWFYDYSLFDIFTTAGNVAERLFCYDIINHQLSWGTEYSTRIDDYIYADTIAFDNRYIGTITTFENGTQRRWGRWTDDAVKMNSHMIQYARDLDFRYPTVDDPDNTVRIIYPVNIDGEIYSNSLTFKKPQKVSNLWRADINDNANGFYVIRGDVNDRVVYRPFNFRQLDYTLLPVGQLLTIQIVGYIPTQFVVFQTRVFRVLSQELDANGVNNVELVLFK